MLSGANTYLFYTFTAIGTSAKSSRAALVALNNIWN